MSDAALVAALLSVDPEGLGGVWVRARHGAAREGLMRALEACALRPVQVRPGMDTTAVFGGVDLTASLSRGQIVETKGVIADGGLVNLCQAERVTPALAAQLAAALEARAGTALAILDEGTEDDALPPTVLRERVAFFLHEGSEVGATWDVGIALPLAEVTVPEALIADAVIVAAQLGVSGVRPVLQTVAAARAHAALNRRETAIDDDLAAAARLVLGHRAEITEDAPQDTPPPPPSSDGNDGDRGSSETTELPQDVVLEAAQTALPSGLLASLALRSRLASGTGEGLARLSDTRGRPLPPRSGRLDGRKRIDLLATLQAAAPWQGLRGQDGAQLRLRPEDIRVKRYRDRSERLLIFAVDASGSAAMARLAEAKGAAESLLADAYEHRDRVCLTVFRDLGAELVVPPTRSLTRAKRLLSALPGGGATPLAAGLLLAGDLAEAARRAGQLPQVILMTDGRANRALDGSTNREAAAADAARGAERLRGARVPVVILDSGRRQSRHLSDLADRLNADVVPLPRLSAALHDSPIDV